MKDKDNKKSGMIIAMAVIATFVAMYAVHNIEALEKVKHAVGLDD